MSDTPKSSYIIQNKAIDGYFQIALQGLLAAGTAYRDDKILVSRAMSMARTAYDHRCKLLGQTHAKNPDA